MTRTHPLATAVQLGTFTLLAILGGLLGQQLTQPAALADGANASGSRIAVANIARLFNESERTRRRGELLTKSLEAKEKEFKIELAAIESERKALESKGWDRDSSVFREKLKEISRKMETFKAEIEWARLEHKREMAMITEELYEDILAEIAAYAAEKHYDLVLRLDDLPAKSVNERQLTAKISGKQILYKSTSIDITGPVLARLNKK